jgi:hypothetical protein
VKTKSGSNERHERLTTVGDFGVFEDLETRNGGLWLASGLPGSDTANPLQIESNGLESEGIVAYAPGSLEFQQTADCAPHPASNLLPYSVVLENQADTDVITFYPSWSGVSMNAQDNAWPLYTRTPWRLNLTVIPAHRRILFTPLGDWDPLDFVPAHGTNLFGREFPGIAWRTSNFVHPEMTTRQATPRRLLVASLSDLGQSCGSDPLSQDRSWKHLSLIIGLDEWMIWTDSVLHSKIPGIPRVASNIQLN